MITGQCPRCHGTLTRQYDEGWEDECLQCGFIQPIEHPKPNNLNHRRYDISMPYASSPMTCACIAYNTLPRFARLH